MFLIIDGSSLLTTSFYANLPSEFLREKNEEKKKEYYNQILHSADGTFTNAVYTMTASLIKMLNVQKPDHIAVVFDKSRNTFRRVLYPDYKAQRSETPEPLKQQFVTMENILKDCGFTVLYSAGYEADDYAGALVETFKGTEPIRLVTKDHDYTQLVDDSFDIKLWLLTNSLDQMNKIKAKCGDAQSELNKPDRAYELNEENVLSLEGVKPCQIPDLKGICGDTSDNIPGIHGVSDKTAIPLLKEYGSLEKIILTIAKTNDKELKTIWKERLGITRSPISAIWAGKDIGLLSKYLATIRKDIYVSENIEEYSVKKIDKEKLKEDLHKLDIVSLDNFI